MHSCSSVHLIWTCVLFLTSLCNSLQCYTCMPTCIIVFMTMFLYAFFLHVCFIPSLQLCETSCVFTLPGLPAPREQAASSRTVTSNPLSQTLFIARRTTCLPHDMAVCMCLRACCVRVMQFVPSLSNSVWPAVRIDSTCVHLLVYLQQSCHSTLVLSDLNQAEKWRQALAAYLSKTCFCFTKHASSENQINWQGQVCSKFCTATQKI